MSPRRPPVRARRLVVLMAALALGAGAPSRPDDDRERAVTLVREHRALEAMPLLEKLAKELPDDRVIQEGLVIALVSQSATVDDDQRPAILKRARAILLKILEDTGELSPLGSIYLDQIPPDGQFPVESRDKGVARALRDAEAAFAKRDFVKAREGYGRALALDPKHYHANLFMGDTYFADKDPARAAGWFAKAAAIDPDKAVAFRYWGDALRDLGKMAEARDRYLDGIVAEPYNRAPWLSLFDWAKRNGVTLTHPPSSPTPPSRPASPTAPPTSPRIRRRATPGRRPGSRPSSPRPPPIATRSARSPRPSAPCSPPPGGISNRARSRPSTRACRPSTGSTARACSTPTSSSPAPTRASTTTTPPTAPRTARP